MIEKFQIVKRRVFAFLSPFFVRRISLPKDRFSYQKNFVEFGDLQGLRVLDVGSGNAPFPFATVLVDLYLENTKHRLEDFVSHGKPVVVADVQKLPFADKEFDFVYCSHVLEHVDDPILACEELMRVAPRGYIETPTFMQDALFSWADGMHRWHIVPTLNGLVFFEYTKRQAAGIRSRVWQDIMFGLLYHPLQKVYRDNYDLFLVMFSWECRFSVDVYYADGTRRQSGHIACVEQKEAHG